MGRQRGRLGRRFWWIAGMVPLTALTLAGSGAAWEPSTPVEFVVPAGTGGGADQMARLIAGLAEKHKLSPGPFIVVNKSGGAGAEGRSSSPSCWGTSPRTPCPRA